MHVVADQGAGRLAVLLHGQPGGGRDFAGVLPLLGSDDLRVVTVDRPGYGANPAPPTGFAGNAAALAELVDRLSPTEPVLLLGLSWSAGAVLAYAATHPDRVAGLLLAAPVGAPEAINRVDQLMALPVSELVFQRLLPRLSFLVEAVSGSHLTPGERTLGRSQGRALTPRDWLAFRIEQHALIAETPALWDRLGPTPYPVTVVHGTRDTAVPPHAAHALAERLAARFVDTSAGHLLHLQVPVLLAAELRHLAGARIPAG
jgi:pimeloyl-ACP methyl ester carboxylesterase